MSGLASKLVAMPTGNSFLRLSKAFAPISDDVWNMVYKSFLVTEGVPERLYHYTDAQGLEGVLRSGEVWATDCRSTNDPQEGRYAWDLLDKLVRSARGREPPEPVSDAVRLLIQYLIEVDDSRSSESGSAHRLGQLYVSSFSQNPDDMGQWRAYGSDGRGFSIGTLARQVVPPAHVSWARVIYKEDEQSNIIGHIIQKLADRLPAFCEAQGVELSHAISFAANSVEGLVDRLRPFFKHRAYIQEQEWRLVRGVDFFQESEPPRVRALGSRLLSYMPIELKNDRGFMPLCRITLGPAQYDDGTVSAVDALLRESRYIEGEASEDPLPEVLRSELPYRSLR